MSSVANPIARTWYRLVDLLPLPTLRTQRRLALAALLAQALIAVTGSVVRVTASGLGCPTWPKCHDDSLLPIPSAEVPWWHQAIEFGNRQIAVWIVVTTAAAIVLAVTRARRRREVLVYAWILPASTLFQGILGGITVLTDLRWWIVGAHLLVSTAMVWLAATLYVKVGQPDDGIRVDAAPPQARRLAAASVVALALALAAGVTVTGAGPHAGDRTNPEAMDRLHASIPVLTIVHASFVLLYVALLIGAVLVIRRGVVDVTVAGRLRIVLIVALAQSLIGLVQYLTNVPALLVVLHVAGACSVVAETAILYQVMRPRVARAVSA
ncbi:MAG: COX15/CtaA family protein [Gordonia sp. (in: high G+C Gram-positive bacteria)]|uniref:COX15/CtaA family protein n=1 Tax=Gordonia sp. (in: high G+C Gram-positive bacteria) TaxID=84139 RepID=UPI0039E2F6E7